MRQDYHLNADTDTGSSVREEKRARSGTVGIRPARTVGPLATACSAAIIARRLQSVKRLHQMKIIPKTKNRLFKSTTSHSLRSISKVLWSYLLWQFLVI